MATTDTQQDPINAPMTYEQLQALAASQASSEIAGKNAPLTAEAGTLGTQETTARTNIGSEFGALMPYVQSSAQRVGAAEGQALTMEQQVFAAAGQRMNQLHQNMAAEAQQLAQQMGGPVSAGQFTQALAPYEQNMPNMQASGMLHGLGMAMSGAQEAEQFAGQVFPAMQTEQQANSDSYYNDQIKTLQGQIAANEGTKSELTNSKLGDLLQKERDFKLQTTQAKLDKLKSQRDWKVQQQQIASSKLSGKMSKAAAKRAGISLGLQEQSQKMSQKRLNAELQHMSVSERQAWARLGLSREALAARIQHQRATTKAGAARVSDSISKDAISMVQAAMGGGKPVSRTYRAYVPGGQGTNKFHTPPGAYWDPKKGNWYRIGHETMTPQQFNQLTGQGGAGSGAISDPNRLYDLVRGSLPQLGRKATVNLIRAQTNMKNWSPGKNMNYTGADLHSMPLGVLYGIAKDAGYPKVIRKAGRQALVDFIMSRVHNPGHPGANP
jgi:hypothetical protein